MNIVIRHERKNGRSLCALTIYLSVDLLYAHYGKRVCLSLLVFS